MLFLGIAATLITTTSAPAQVTGATLSATVTDASNAVVPGARISATNQATEITRG
jgi:hypothetical protein